MAEADPNGDRRGPADVRLPSVNEWRVVRDARLAALQDAPGLLLPTQPHESSWSEARWRLSWQNGAWAVAHDDGHVVGLARLTRGDIGVHVESVWTHPRHRRRGIASALVRELVAKEREGGPSEVFVWVVPPNPAAVGLYTKLGFVPTDDRQWLAGLGRMEERLRLSGDVRAG
jgi:ribosomal protein S18 acetylase RimI-like enzyme